MSSNAVNIGKRQQSLKVPMKRKKDTLSKNIGQSKWAKISRTSLILLCLRDNAEEVKSGVYSIDTFLQLLPSTEQDKNNKLPEWKNIGKNKLCFYQLAMQQIEEQESLTDKPDDEKLMLVPFVFNLSERLQQQLIRAKRTEAAECNDLLRKTLKRYLNRKVDLWFHIEMASCGGKGKEHIQGSMLISANEHDRVKQALRKMNSEANAGFRKFELRLRHKKRRSETIKYGLLRADINWAMYCYKEHGTVKLTYLDQDRPQIVEPFSKSHEIGQLAKKLYNELRAEQIKRIRSKSQVTYIDKQRLDSFSIPVNDATSSQFTNGVNHAGNSNYNRAVCRGIRATNRYFGTKPKFNYNSIRWQPLRDR